jgi:hypothetical protein
MLAYSNFTLAKLKKDYGLEQKEYWVFSSLSLTKIKSSDSQKVLL